MSHDAAAVSDLPAITLVERIRAGDLAPTDVLEAHLARIDERDDELNAYVTVTEDLARAQAGAVEARLDGPADAGDEPGPLAGVPVALKDLGNAREGVRHTFGSALIDEQGVESSRTSVAVRRLEEAGAVVLGTTNVPEFGHKATTVNDVVGATASPVAPSLNAGGSSGGSAAAVGAGMAAIALGSDAGGSIRIPAAACGVFGLKPSFGLVPNDSRPDAFGKRVHHAATGPLTRTVADAALAMDVLADPHPRDPASVPVEIDYRAGLDRDPADLRVAYSPALDVFPVEDEVTAVVEDALADLADAGATVETVDVDHGLSMAELGDAVETTFTTSVLSGVLRVRESFGIDLREHPEAVSDSLLAMCEHGETYDAADVAATGTVRTAVFDAVQELLAEYDVLATPTLARAGIGLHEEVGHDKWGFALAWPFNWTGHPAASAPAGTTAAGHPVGLQLVGPRYGDDEVLAASAAFEGVRPWLGG